MPTMAVRHPLPPPKGMHRGSEALADQADCSRRVGLAAAPSRSSVTPAPRSVRGPEAGRAVAHAGGALHKSGQTSAFTEWRESASARSIDPRKQKVLEKSRFKGRGTETSAWLVLVA